MRIDAVVVVAVLGASLSLLIKKLRPELAMMVGGVTGAALLILGVGELTGLFQAFSDMALSYGLETEYVGLCIKLIGIAYLAQLGALICADAGESAIAAKVELCGRILILCAALPTAAGTLKAAAKLLADTMP